MTKVVARSNRISKHDAIGDKIRIKRPDTKQKKQVSRRTTLSLHIIGAKGLIYVEVGAFLL
jgi:hypothetical protein